jgi:galactonate dehydratase
LAAIMKITHVLPWLVRTSGSFLGEYLFVEVRTDVGLSGRGAVTTTTPTANRAVVALLRQAGTLLHGEDPSRIEAIWHRVFRSFTYLGTRGATSHAVSGIDIALWDLRGRALGLPVYELLGGKLRDDVLLYTHPLGGSHRHDDDLVRETRHCRFGAYRAQDRPVPASSRKSPANDDFLDGNLDREAEREAVRLTTRVRQVAGDRVELLIDWHGRFNVPTAVRLCPALEDAARLDWFEEPVPVESVDALAEVREWVNAPISVGERLHTRWEFALVLQRRLANYVMPDVTWTGGITELRKIASLAETYSVPVSPHDAGGRSMSLRGRT